MLRPVILTSILLGLTLSVLGGEPDDRSGVSVSGTISVLTRDHARVSGAKVWFQRNDGQTFVATTNEIGEYETLLTSGYDYTITIAGKQLCAIHRPSLKPKPGSRLRFDFTTTYCGDIGVRMTGQPSVAGPNDNRPYYRHYYETPSPHWFFEESLARGEHPNRDLVMAFGTRKGNSQIEYGPFHIRGYPQSLLPVTISFDTYTVQADAATLNQESRVMTALGHVLVADGSDSQPRTAACVMLRLDDPELHPQACEDEQSRTRE